MNKNQLIVVSGFFAYIVGGSVVVIFNLETFIEILRFHPNLLMPIIKTYSIILITGITLIYFLRNNRVTGGILRCSRCNKELSINNSELFLRRYWCRKHYLEEVKNMNSKGDSKSRLKTKIKRFLALMNKKQTVAILIGIFVMLPLVFQISEKINNIRQCSNKDYISRVYKAYPEYTAGQIDKYFLKKKFLLWKDLFWLFAGLIVVGGIMGSFCYLYKKDKSKPKNGDN